MVNASATSKSAQIRNTSELTLMFLPTAAATANQSSVPTATTGTRTTANASAPCQLTWIVVLIITGTASTANASALLRNATKALSWMMSFAHASALR